MADELATITGTVYKNAASTADRVPWPGAVVRAVPVLLDETAAISDSVSTLAAVTDAAGLVTMHLWPGKWKIYLPDGEVIDGDGDGVTVEAGTSYTLLGLRGYVAPPTATVNVIPLSSLTATTLEPGEDATVEADGDGLVLGIPRGADGVTDYNELDNRPTFKTVTNRTGATIPADTLVEIDGAFGVFSTVRVADNTTADHVAGITVAAIADGADGEIQVTGTVEGLDTSAFTAGAPLYLGTSGAWTETRPTAPAHIIRVGVAGVTHPTAGTVVFTLPAFEITADHVDGLDAKVTELAEDPTSDLGASLSSTYAGMCYVPTIPSALSWPAAYDPGVTAIADVPGGGAAATVTTRPGDIFDAVTTARTNPGAVFYVSTTGSDAAAGTSWATAFRSIRAAILAANTAAVPTLIYVDAGKYERNYQPGHLDASPTVDIAFVANGRVNTGTWDAPATPVADGTYTNTYSWTLSNAERIMTTDVLTADGLYTELLNVATPTLVNTTPGSWCISGGTVYVRRLDGSAPSATNTRIYRGATYQAMRIASHVNVYIGGVNDLSGWDMEGGTSAVLNAYITPAPSSAKVLAVENCTFRYAGGTTANAKGVRVDSWRGLAYFYNCSSDANSSDGFNFHNGSAAADVHALTVNCSGHDNGRKGNASCNGWTNHEDCVGIDVSGVYKRNRGGTVACINSCLTYLAGSVVMDDLGDIALGGTQVPTGIRTADTAEMWVERARVVLAASGQARAYEARGTSQIHRRNTWPVPQADSIDAGATIDTY